MMPKNRKILEQRIVKKFNDYRKGVLTKEFRLIASDIQSDIFAQSGCIEGEEKGLILFYMERASWTFLTSKRIVWNDNGNMFSIPYCHIAGATPPWNSKTSRNRMEYFHLIDLDGVIHKIPMEPLGPIIGIAHILNRISIFFPHDSQTNDMIIDLKTRLYKNDNNS